MPDFTEYVSLSTRCPLCGGTYLHAAGCHDCGKSFIKLTQIDSMHACDPAFLAALRWQEEMRAGTQVIPILE